jgi:hypothetical protein
MFVAELRDKAASSRNCCARHGDAHSLGFLQATDEAITVHGANGPAVYSLHDFARTAPLDQLMRRGIKSVSANKLCRLHAQGRCKFGKDCKNIHICPKATPLENGVEVHTTPVKNLQSENSSLYGSSVKDACGLSCTASSNKSSHPDSPLEKTMALSVNDVSIMSDSGFSLFSQPMKSTKLPSPQFDVTGFETAMSRVQMDLWRINVEEARSPEWKPW